MLNKKVETMRDFLELLIFLLISPIIGILMLVGMIATSIAMICIYIKDFIMGKFYE